MAITANTNKFEINTTEKQFGSSSLEFNGVDNFLNVTATLSEFNFGTDPFTVEGWVRFDDVSTEQMIVTNSSTGFTTGNWQLKLTDTANLEFTVHDETAVTGSTTLVVDTWYHFAIERLVADSSTMYVTLDGASECGIGSMPADTSFGESGQDTLYFGHVNNDNVLDGYLDEIRISDIGRYTSFPATVPTSAFTTDGNTLKIFDMENIGDLKTVTSVSIDFSQLSLGLLPGTNYRIALTEGFTIASDASRSLSTAVDSFGTFTTGPADTVLSSSDPSNLATAVVNNNSIDLTFSPDDVRAGTTPLNLYSVVGNVDTLVNAFDTSDTSEVTYTGNVATVNTLGYIDADTTYRLDIDDTSIVDLDEFTIANLPSSVTFTTDIDANFPKFQSDLTSTATLTTAPRVILFADRFLTQPEDSTVNYTEDTTTAVTGTPTVADYTTDGSGTYTLTVTPSTASYVDTISATGTATVSFNDTSKVLTLSGTRDAVNDSLSTLTILTENDITASFDLDYLLTTPSSDTATKTQTLNNSVADAEVSSNISDARSYTANNFNEIFATNTPQITDFDIDEDYQIQLTSPIGAFSSLSDNSDYATTWTFSGTKAQVNAKISDIKFWPTAGTSSNSTFTYVQRKDGVVQVSVTPTLNGSAGTFTSTVRTLSDAQSYTLSKDEELYAGQVDVLVVGGGGGGTYGGGGGAGGYVTESLNNDISTIDWTSKYFYAVVGSGGASGGHIDNASSWTEHGSDGGDSSVEIYESGFASGDGSWTASHGQGGRNYYGGFGTFSTNFDGGSSAWGGGPGFGQPQNTNQWAGGGGAGADQGGYSASAETGGAGGRGLQSSITGTALRYGGGGGAGSYGTVSAGGNGGGGDGADLLFTEATAGTNGLGGGGGAGYHSQAVGTVVGEAGKSGGSGTVIIKFKA
jgi:hypothetical protein